MKAAFLTLGCKLNYAETSTYERAFREAGWETVSPDTIADVYLINTCSVTATSDSKSRNLIRKVHRINPDARIVVTGCSAELRRKELQGIEGVWRVFGAGEKGRVVRDTVAGIRSDREYEPCFMSAAGRVSSGAGCFAAFSFGERTRSFLKVQDGCDNLCAYCTVPFARGESRNVPIDECVRNAETIAAEGVKEIVLTGVNTGDFGKSSGESFLDLLKALHSVNGIERYRISSIEPNLLTEGIVDWIAADGFKFQPHFHIPLQTGCDELLEAMGRRYDTAFFESKIGYIRKKLERKDGPKVFFGIDVIVGLPGETEERFNRTVAFLERIHPAFIHVFPYSRRPGTPAAGMSGQVDEQEKDRRVKVLEDMCSSFHKEFEEAHSGMELPVLFESRDKGGLMSGYTSNYIRVSRPYNASAVGEIIMQKL